MSSSTSLPSDTADAEAAKAQGKKRRSAAKAEARAKFRATRKQARAAKRGQPAAPETGASGEEQQAVGAEQSTGLAGLRDRVVELWLRRIRPVLDVVSPVGWAVLAATAVCWFLGLTLHVTELNVIAFTLTVPLVIAALFVLGRASYKVTLDLQTHRVVVGTRAVGRVEADKPHPARHPALPHRARGRLGHRAVHGAATGRGRRARGALRRAHQAPRRPRRRARALRAR